MDLGLRVTVPSESEAVSLCPPGRRVLVVDDTEDCARCLALLLELDGHEVQIACTALEAIECAERFRPAVIFMDIGLPCLDGFEAIRRIRAQRWGRDIVICALTGFDGPEHSTRSRELGANHHLVKPADFQALTRIMLRSKL